MVFRIPEPGIKSWYPSSMCSKYYCWFHALGYSELDILEYKDGSWDIIQYYNKPYIPSLTKWQVVLGNMKNVSKTFGFIEKYVKQCDMQQQEFWDRENGKSELAIREHEALLEHKAEAVERAHQAIVNNPDLMDRIAKEGLEAMDLDNIAKHIPRTEYTKAKVKDHGVSAPSVPTNETVYEKVSGEVPS